MLFYFDGMVVLWGIGFEDLVVKNFVVYLIGFQGHFVLQ